MRGVDDPDEAAAFHEFSEGRTLALVRLYAERGDLDRAATIARLALAEPDCPDAAEVEAILERAGAPPEDWKEQLDQFVAAPSYERWQGLIRFIRLHGGRR
jgi:hypothetical protein